MSTRPGGSQLRAWRVTTGLVPCLVLALVARAGAQAPDAAEDPAATSADEPAPGVPYPTSIDEPAPGDEAATPDPRLPPAAPAATPGQLPRKPGTPWAQIFAGPFPSSRLFSMPIADVVGAFQMSLSGDGSLLQETGLLSSAGVLAVGFGDIAQLEYRHTGVIGVDSGTAPIPAIGVQLKAPLRERRFLPAFAVAFRLGVPRTERFGDTDVEESVTDFYIVGRLRLWGPLHIATLHGGLRVSAAEMDLGGDAPIKRTMYLPAGGWEVTMNRRTRLIGEAALVPTFDLGTDIANPTPKIGYGVLGRMGIRWFVHPSFAIDASVGYQLEVAKQTGSADRGPSAVVDWDIRLGGELFVPWGAIVCRAAGIFCE